MKSLLILQNVLATYRRPVFDELAKHYHVSVLHAGPSATDTNLRHREAILPYTKFGPFYWQSYIEMIKIQKQFDVVIAMFDLHWPTYLLPLFKHKRPKYVLFGHRYSGRWLADTTRDWLMKKADRLLMYGEEEIKRMIQRGIDDAKIVVAPNTVDVPNRADFSTAPKKSFLFVGRLQERKRIDLVMDSFARLQGRIHPGTVLDIVGNGAQEDALRQRAETLGIAEKVLFHGRLEDHESLSRLFARAWAYVSPGPVGLGVLHSFAYGVPVVTLKEGRHGPEFQNLKHNSNALILERADGLDTALRSLCNRPDFARALGRNAHDHYAQNRTLDLMIAGFRKAIEE